MGHRRGCRSSHGSALMVGSTRPITITWLSVSALGLRSTGFMRACGVVRAASACRYCARLISVPSGVTAALLLMFCALKGATRTPRVARCLHRAVTRKDLPASLEQPMIMMGLAICLSLHGVSAVRATPQRRIGQSGAGGTKIAVTMPCRSAVALMLRLGWMPASHDPIATHLNRQLIIEL